MMLLVNEVRKLQMASSYHLAMTMEDIMSIQLLGHHFQRISVLDSIVKANGNIQKLQLFSLGKAISGAPIIIGSCQLASPTKAGINAPKIIISACIVVI